MTSANDQTTPQGILASSTPPAHGMEWDLIGVAGVPEAADEYDCMISPLLQRLFDGADTRALFDWISQERSSHFGAGPDDVQDMRLKVLAGIPDPRSTIVRASYEPHDDKTRWNDTSSESQTATGRQDNPEPASQDLPACSQTAASNLDTEYEI